MEARLMRRLGDAEKEVASARKEVLSGSAVPDESWLGEAALQLNEMAARVEQVHETTEGAVSRIEGTVVSTTRQIAELRCEVTQLGAALDRESQRADAAELLASELANISGQVAEAKKLVQLAKAQESTEASALHGWAENELKNL